MDCNVYNVSNIKQEGTRLTLWRFVDLKRNGFLVLTPTGKYWFFMLTFHSCVLYLWLSLAATGRSPLVHLGHALHEPRHIILWSPSYVGTCIFIIFRILAYYPCVLNEWLDTRYYSVHTYVDIILNVCKNIVSVQYIIT